jgi:hypothetical protein
MDDLRRLPMNDLLKMHKAAVCDAMLSLEMLETKQQEAISNNNLREAELYEVAIDVMRKTVTERSIWINFLSSKDNKNGN